MTLPLVLAPIALVLAFGTGDVARRLRGEGPDTAASPAALSTPAAAAPRPVRRGNAWVRMEGPLEGIVVRNPDRSWARAHAANLLARCAREVHRRHGSRVGPLFVADWSCREGGGRCRPHRSHRRGRDVDVGYLVRRKAWRPELFRPRQADLHVDAVLDLLGCLAAGDALEVVFTDRRFLPRLVAAAPSRLGAVLGARVAGLLEHLRGHDTHLHVRFRKPGGPDRVAASSRRRPSRVRAEPPPR